MLRFEKEKRRSNRGLVECRMKQKMETGCSTKYFLLILTGKMQENFKIFDEKQKITAYILHNTESRDSN